MANEEQVALLRQGNEVWNAWRKENPDVEIDLSYANLRSADLHYANLSGADLRDTDLSYANLSFTNLSGANLSRANLRDVNLHGASLSRTDLSFTNLKGVIISNFTRLDPKWKMVYEIVNQHISHRNLSSANLSDINTSKINFSFTNFSFTNLKGGIINALLKNAVINTLTELDPKWKMVYEVVNQHVSYRNLSNADLSGADLSDVDLSNADFSKANLISVNFSGADLSGANFREANLSGADLCDTDLSDADLSNADLSKANLISANLSGTKLFNANLISANLSDAKLFNADLFHSNLSDANLSNANLRASQVLYTNFGRAILTGACIADWQIGSTTDFRGIKCDYIFRTYDLLQQQFTGRLPVDLESTFAPGEFTQRFQIIASALETIDITFTEGIDWQAFFQSFQDLKRQYPDQGIAIQGMEEKGDAFIVRLKVETEETGSELEQLKASIETTQKQLYSTQLSLREAQGEIKVYREMMGVVKTLAGKPMGDQHFYGQVGNVAGTNHGQMTAYINQNNESISQLITALRTSAQSFPVEQQEEVLMQLDDLKRDIEEPEKADPKRIGRRLQRLIAAGTAAATLAGGAATFSGNINQFTDNVLELGEKIGLTREAILGDQSNP